MAVPKTPLARVFLLAGWLALPGAAIAADAPDPAPAADEATPVQPEPDPVNRITMARFARAFGLLTRDTPPEELVEEPYAEIDADTLRRTLAESGLERRDWDEMLERMRDDESFRERVETLSASYRLGH
jgi:hypothetical protein